MVGNRVIVGWQTGATTVTTTLPSPPPPPGVPTGHLGTMTPGGLTTIFPERWVVAGAQPTGAQQALQTALNSSSPLPTLTFPRLEIPLAGGGTFVMPEIVYVGLNFGTEANPSQIRTLLEATYRSVVAQIAVDPAYANSEAMRAYAASAGRGESVVMLGTNQPIGYGGITQPVNWPGEAGDLQLEAIVSISGLDLDTLAGQLAMVQRFWHEGPLGDG